MADLHTQCSWAAAAMVGSVLAVAGRTRGSRCYRTWARAADLITVTSVREQVLLLRLDLTVHLSVLRRSWEVNRDESSP